MLHNFAIPSSVVFVCVMAALTSMSAIDVKMKHKLADVALSPRSNGQGVGLLIRRLRDRFPQEVCAVQIPLSIVGTIMQPYLMLCER